MSSLYDLGSIFVKWENLNVWIVESLQIYLQTICIFGCRTSDEALLSLFSSWLRLLLELRSLDDELDKLLSSLELRSLDEELDQDDEEEDSFENLEEWPSIDPSAIVNSFLGTDLEDHELVCELVQSFLQTY